MRSKIYAMRLLVVVIACFLLSPVATGPAYGTVARVAIVSSYGAGPYLETLEAFKRTIDKSGLTSECRVYQLGGDASKAALAVQDIKKSRPTLVFCIGTLAVDKVRAEITDIPVVASMVLKASEIRRSPNMTGVTLEIPPETHFQWIRKALPNAKTVGVVYNPAENKERIAAATKLAQKMGLKLEAHEVSDARDLQPALQKLSNADVLWSVIDSQVVTVQNAKQMLVFSMSNRIPLVGPSSAWSKAGALYAIESDYGDLGTQCAELATKLLQGTPVASVQPAAPRKVSLTVNLRAASDLGVKLPPDVVKSASANFF